MTETKTEITSVTPLPRKVISGGQTGADQAGLIVAQRFGIPTGGWMPRGWKTATGANPQLAEAFGLREHTGDYADRTAANVRDSDGTIRFAGSFRIFGERCTLKWITGLLPISWSSDNGSYLFVHSVDEGSGGSSSTGTYLSQVAENSAGVRYPRELCGRSVLYSPFQSAPNARACGSLSNSSRSRNSSRTLLWNDSA